MGRSRGSGGVARVRRRARHRVRRDELEHVPGQRHDDGRRGDQLQVRLARPLLAGRPQAGRRAQHLLHRARRAARLDGADGVARRRDQPSGASRLPAPVRAGRRRPPGDPRGAARRVEDVHRAQALRAGVLLVGQRRLGFVTAARPARGGAGSAVSSTSATTSRTRTSSRSSAGWRWSAGSVASTSTTPSTATTI